VTDEELEELGCDGLQTTLSGSVGFLPRAKSNAIFNAGACMQEGLTECPADSRAHHHNDNIREILIFFY
jgi:hypothetical protein